MYVTAYNIYLNNIIAICFQTFLTFSLFNSQSFRSYDTKKLSNLKNREKAFDMQYNEFINLLEEQTVCKEKRSSTKNPIVMLKRSEYKSILQW